LRAQFDLVKKLTSIFLHIVVNKTAQFGTVTQHCIVHGTDGEMDIILLFYNCRCYLN